MTTSVSSNLPTVPCIRTYQDSRMETTESTSNQLSSTLLCTFFEFWVDVPATNNKLSCVSPSYYKHRTAQGRSRMQNHRHPYLSSASSVRSDSLAISLNYRSKFVISFGIRRTLLTRYRRFKTGPHLLPDRICSCFKLYGNASPSLLIKPQRQSATVYTNNEWYRSLELGEYVDCEDPNLSVYRP